MSEHLKIWTVYNSPTDFPDLYVARLFHNDQPQADHFTSEHLEPIRTRLRAMGLVQLARHADDEVQIVETWI